MKKSDNYRKAVAMAEGSRFYRCRHCEHCDTETHTRPVCVVEPKGKVYVRVDYVCDKWQRQSREERKGL